ncbi:Stk1 family PASTA domain-containing Ser/Thr kinase [Rathayibacter toxicus]|uniref:non-specific serine/threonine protein kinase n=1 Tax=Rathayibacter toxicus TaxID=145458 RepID=A0A2S5Y6L1_9MICO|nr:Stk1 family PASTA domain-containing Ser/Thr kinase [Rathayibacter toxicus]PPH23585.1 Stk1 family PASTA domain-containing Ser/Thr kinase [Rathayibacter toxicus]PPH57390.1 Stk1 family PASTA domain-containing Ser/Thr kinase [Rathayibacter toxicus]PPH59890.1 Stk1 family PASTA domain-containing Ser/Thr kinase [Rathayibacter toxicus]PPH87346.1 Stk1 family PASTA domain-containing Ser/Thr kinase [Rathayibacter toxicus]PPI15113.1 Stk1 family PASTA domain-containing Ser/Thr kinase [Rathayibacter toxi
MTTSQLDPLLGRLVDGRYEVRSRIARGGMATVYLAHDQRLERRVAMKIMHGHLADDTTFKNRFVQEARSAARLAHPNVVSVFDQGQDSDMAYLVMEYLPGITLRDLLKERRRLTAQQVVDIMHSVLSGLAAAHRAGIVHRDLKPENVLLADDGRIKIGDFGLARAATANTASGQALLGTVAYLSPELVTRGTADTRSDIYAIGIMIYEMLTGEQPFTGEQPMQIAYQHANDSVPYPSATVPSVPTSLDELVIWATERDPDMRPRDAGVMLAQLLEAERSMGITPSGRHDDTQAVTPLPSAESTILLPYEDVLSGPASGFTEPGGDELVPVEDDAVARLAAQGRVRRRRGAVLVLLVLLLALLGGGAAWWFGEGPGALRSVPSVVGLSKEDAISSLEAQGFVAQPETTPDTHVPVGTVMSTQPAATENVKKGSVVTLTVSSGPRQLPVPALAGLTQKEAEAAIAGGSFQVGDTTKIFDPKVKAGVVISASLPDGSALPGSLSENSTIALVVSLGPIPNVVGLSVDDATNKAKAAGLALNRSGEDWSDSVAAGIVLTQANPKSPATTGATISVVVSKGPKPVSVPNVVGMTRDQAKAALEAVGLSSSYSLTTLGPLIDTAPNEITKVTNQSNKAGDQVQRGTTIQLSLTITT